MAYRIPFKPDCHNMMKTLLVGLTMLILPLYATASVASGEPAPEFQGTDAHGKAHKLSDFRGKYVVLEWYNHGCPFVKKYYKSGAMQGLQKQLTEAGVVWLSINSGAQGKQGHMSPAETLEKAASVGAASTAMILDENGQIGRLFGAKATPHMFLIDPEGVLLYQGAIDSISSARVEDIEKAENYLVAAYDAHREGRPVAVHTTQAYGCSVKY